MSLQETALEKIVEWALERLSDPLKERIDEMRHTPQRRPDFRRDLQRFLGAQMMEARLEVFLFNDPKPRQPDFENYLALEKSICPCRFGTMKSP